LEEEEGWDLLQEDCKLSYTEILFYRKRITIYTSKQSEKRRKSMPPPTKNFLIIKSKSKNTTNVAIFTCEKNNKCKTLKIFKNLGISIRTPTIWYQVSSTASLQSQGSFIKGIMLIKTCGLTIIRIQATLRGRFKVKEDILETRILLEAILLWELTWDRIIEG